jgi:hypothetical protein
MKGAKDISVVPIQVLYDPRRLQVLTVSGGNLLNQDGQASALVQRVDSSAGRITVSISRPSSVSGISGEGTIFTVSFMSKAIGRSKLRIDHAGLRDTSAKTVSVKSSDASVSISASANRPKAETDTGSTDANVIPPPSPTNSRNAEDVGQGWEVQGNDAFPSVHQGWEESPTLNFGLGIASVAGTITPGVNLDVRHQLAVGVPYRF